MDAACAPNSQGFLGNKFATPPASPRPGDDQSNASEASSPDKAHARGAESEYDGGAHRGAADGDESTNTVDEAAFLRVMAQRASDEIKDTDALLATFKALDLDGNGVLEVNEIVEALANVKGGAPAPEDQPQGCAFCDF